MAVDPKLLQFALSAPIERAYAECVERLVENIAKHLGSGNAIRTADWELNKLKEMGKLTEENAKIIKDASDTAAEKLEIVDLLRKL